MINKLVVIINSIKVSKIKKILLYEMKFLVLNYSCLQNPWLGGYRPQIPVLFVLCPQLNLLNPHTSEQNSWVRHCHILSIPSQKHPAFAVRLTHNHHQMLFSKYVSFITTFSVFACWPSIVVTRSLQDISQCMVCAQSLCGLCRKV